METTPGRRLQVRVKKYLVTEDYWYQLLSSGKVGGGIDLKNIKTNEHYIEKFMIS